MNAKNAKQYLKQKKKNLIRLVDNYNRTISDRGTSEKEDFQIKDRENLDIEKEFCRPDLCKRCGGGNCCVTFPCVFSPGDFLDISNIDYMRRILNTGLICISRVFDGYKNNDTLVLRPRGYEEKNSIVNLTGIKHSIFEDAMNPCVFRDVKNFSGCLLPPEYRPSEGLLRIPYLDSLQIIGHKNMYGMQFCKEEYKIYQEFLKQLASEYGRMLFPIEETTEKDINKFINSLIRK